MKENTDGILAQPAFDGFCIHHKSLFDVEADAYVNTINCVGAMGAGIALEFKKRYPKMFEDYKEKCKYHSIKPGDCYTYLDESGVYILGLAVKDDWRHWSTLKWILDSIKSLKLAVLENDGIRTVNIPLIGGLNGRRGPYGKVDGFAPPPEREEIKKILEKELKPFGEKFLVRFNLCLPDEKPQKQEMTLDMFV